MARRKVVGYMQLVGLELLEPLLHPIPCAIEEVPWSLVKWLEKRRPNQDASPRFQDAVQFGCDSHRIAVMLERIHHDDRFEHLVVKRQAVGVCDDVRVPEYGKLHFNN